MHTIMLSILLIFFDELRYFSILCTCFKNNATTIMMSLLFSVKKWVRHQAPARIWTFFKLGRIASNPKLDASFHSDDKKLSWQKFDKLGIKKRWWSPENIGSKDRATSYQFLSLSIKSRKRVDWRSLRRKDTPKVLK